MSVPSPPLATHTLPPPIAIALGALPTAIVVIGEFVAGSIGLTVSSSASATQTAFSPTTTADGPRPTGILVVVPSASTRRSTPASRYASHVLPNPTAMAFGAALMSVRSSVRPSRASIHVRSPERGATTTVTPRAASEALSPAATIGTRVTCETLSKVGLMRTTVRPVSAGAAAIAAQSRPPATARLCAARRSRTVPITRRDDGEIRESDDESRAETHTDFEPKAIAPGRSQSEPTQEAGRVPRPRSRPRLR